MSTPVYTAEETQTVFNTECGTDDLIFNGQNCGRGIGERNIVLDDAEYNYPDSKRYIFTTISKHIHMVYPNNIVAPVRYKPTLDNYGSKGRIEEAFGTKGLGKGIYVVDYISLHNLPTTSYNDIIAHYLTVSNLELPERVKQEVIRAITVKSGRFYLPKIELRLISFIPEAVLLDNSYIYSPATGMVFTNGELTDNLYHPSTKAYREDVSDITKEYKNVMVIDITNNTKDKAYYIKIGKRVHQVISQKHPRRENGVVLTVKRNGCKSTKIKTTLNDMEVDLGIYDSKEKALTDGNIALLNEQKKLALETQKYELEVQKLEADKEKLIADRDFYKAKYAAELLLQEHKIKMSELDMRSKLLSLEIDIEKAALATQQAYQKHYMDLEHMYRKHSYEMIKVSGDIAVKAITTIQMIYKLFK